MRRFRVVLVLLAAAVCAVNPAAVAEDEPLRVVFVSGSFLYESDAVLTEYKDWLEARYPVEVTMVSATGWHDLPGLDALEDCDTALVFTRRLRIRGEQLERVKAYLTGGNPIVAVRTASHGFQNWLEFDRDILGGDYQNHYDEGPEIELTVTAPDHPVLAGVDRFTSASSLYRNPDIADDCEVLMRGAIPEGEEPVTWTREVKGGRVVYTSLGGPEDFALEPFKRLIANALFWSARRPAPGPAAGAAQ